MFGNNKIDEKDVTTISGEATVTAVNEKDFRTEVIEGELYDPSKESRMTRLGLSWEVSFGRRLSRHCRSFALTVDLLRPSPSKERLELPVVSMSSVWTTPKRWRPSSRTPPCFSKP
jgi:hypothetical protein